MLGRTSGGVMASPWPRTTTLGAVADRIAAGRVHFDVWARPAALMTCG